MGLVGGPQGQPDNQPAQAGDRQRDVRMLNKRKGGNDMDTRGRSQKPWQRAFVVIAAIAVGGFMLIFGVWSLLLPVRGAHVVVGEGEE